MLNINNKISSLPIRSYILKRKWRLLTQSKLH